MLLSSKPNSWENYMSKFNLYSIDKMTGWLAGYFRKFWKVANSLKISRWLCHHMILKNKNTQSGPFFWRKPHIRNRHMIICLECDLTVKMSSFYLEVCNFENKMHYFTTDSGLVVNFFFLINITTKWQTKKHYFRTYCTVSECFFDFISFISWAFWKIDAEIELYLFQISFSIHGIIF